MRKSRGVEKREWVTALRVVVLGTVGGSLAVFLLLVASAYAFVTMKKIPQAAVPIIILFLSALGALLSGFLTARIAGKRGLPLGACSGLLLFLLFAAAGISICTVVSWPGTITRMLVMILAGALGGYGGIRRK